VSANIFVNTNFQNMFRKSGNDIKHSIPNKTYSKLLSEAMKSAIL